MLRRAALDAGALDADEVFEARRAAAPRSARSGRGRGRASQRNARCARTARGSDRLAASSASARSREREHPLQRGRAISARRPIAPDCRLPGGGAERGGRERAGRALRALPTRRACSAAPAAARSGAAGAPTRTSASVRYPPLPGARLPRPRARRPAPRAGTRADARLRRAPPGGITAESAGGAMKRGSSSPRSARPARARRRARRASSSTATRTSRTRA